MSRSSLSRFLSGSSAAVITALIAFSSSPVAYAAKGIPLVGGQANGKGGDGTMGEAARRATQRGALRLESDAVLKARANAASDRALGRSYGSAAAGSHSAPKVPVVASGFDGQTDPGVTPPDTFGATGPTRYVQTVNRQVGIYSRTSSVPLSSFTLNDLAGWTSSVNSFDPQIIYDGNTARFYYVMDSIFSSSDNRLSFGFSKTKAPNGPADWCKYFINYGAKFPDYPKLGDSKNFMLIGTNNFQPGYTGSDIIAVPKPIGTAAITTCPTFSQLDGGRGRIFQNVTNTSAQLVFTPTPANSIDASVNGYVISRNLSLPSTSLWIHPVAGPAAPGVPTLGAARLVTVPSYTVPPDAAQPIVGTINQRLDTLDARPWQAVLSRNPARGNQWSLWTQHTVAAGTASQINWFEIKPDVAVPIIQRSGSIGPLANTFFFNGAISSDRRPGNAATGDSFVIGYNVTDTTSIFPRIVVGSSLDGGPVTFNLVKDGSGPYRDFACAGSGQTCRWGDYASATPDPKPTDAALSAVGLTHQYSPGGAMPTTQSNWKTWIYHVRP